MTYGFNQWGLGVPAEGQRTVDLVRVADITRDFGADFWSCTLQVSYVSLIGAVVAGSPALQHLTARSMAAGVYPGRLVEFVWTSVASHAASNRMRVC